MKIDIVSPIRFIKTRLVDILKDKCNFDSLAFIVQACSDAYDVAIGKKILLSREEAEELYLNAAHFQILESGGVDNWIGYDEAIREYEEEECDGEDLYSYLSKEFEETYPEQKDIWDEIE